jgi:hypothetical protein
MDAEVSAGHAAKGASNVSVRSISACMWAVAAVVAHMSLLCARLRFRAALGHFAGFMIATLP